MTLVMLNNLNENFQPSLPVDDVTKADSTIRHLVANYAGARFFAPTKTAQTHRYCERKR